MRMDLGLRGRVAIVTGSSKGIGKAIALGLAEEGARVVICARKRQQLEEAREEIQSSTGSEVLALQADLTRRSDIKGLVKETYNRFRSIDILVNNAGGPPATTFLGTPEREWRHGVNLLLMSVIRMCREVIPYMRKQRWGRIINMTSFAAKQPADRLAISNTIRAGIFGLSKTLSNELAEDNVLVNCVCPGWTLTERVIELAKAQSVEMGKPYEEIVHGWESTIPLKRLAQPREIANLVVFLASERASYITGAVIQVDGGLIKALL